MTSPRPPTHFSILIPEAECDSLSTYFVSAMVELLDIFVRFWESAVHWTKNRIGPGFSEIDTDVKVVLKHLPNQLDPAVANPGQDRSWTPFVGFRRS